ncbi:MAG: class I SAM-dependent methyltransferase [Anaerolineae bacterium]|nr:class I SAM-dependent methyltransferase [Anaerolineae bacterium]
MYDKEYYESLNYRNYTSGFYRFWHWVKFVWIGLILRGIGAKTVLDFGCADGVSVAAFRFLGIKAWGIDASDYAVSKAPAQAQDFVWSGKIGDNSFQDNFFDVVVSWDVLEHIDPANLRPVLAELQRLGKRGFWGIYVEDELIAKLHNFIGKQHPDHLSEYTANWWLDTFRSLDIKANRVPLSRKGTFWVSLE